MKTVGIICEYNPFHTGHRKQFEMIREQLGKDTAIVCLMSGNYVQRGAPAIVDKSLRAKAALSCGADLVLELPIQFALSSAEGFAAGGVGILGDFCDYLCFGTENADRKDLIHTAQALLSEEFKPLLKQELDTGKSFPAARQAALAQMGIDSSILSTPNNILGVEYCKAIIARQLAMEPMPIHRAGNYHATTADRNNPSASAVRALMLDTQDWRGLVPEEAHNCFLNAPLHSTDAGHRAILTRLRTMESEEFEALPFGSEGLWRKLMHASRSEATLEEILSATKSKRYTRTRLDRMVLCAFLGLTLEDFLSPVPYTRVLALNNRGRGILRKARNFGSFLNAGEIHDSEYCRKEYRMGDLYGLFCTGGPEAPGIEAKRRVVYLEGSQ